MIWQLLFVGVDCLGVSAGEPRKGITERCRRHFHQERTGRTSGPRPGRKEEWEPLPWRGWSDWRNRSRDLTMRSGLNVGATVEARQGMEELRCSYCTVKKRRACPAGTPPAELWTMLLHASRNLSPAGLGIGYQRKKSIRCAPCLCWNVSFVVCALRAPHHWHGTTAPELLCTRATRLAPRGRELSMCCLRWGNSSSKSC